MALFFGLSDVGRTVVQESPPWFVTGRVGVGSRSLVLGFWRLIPAPGRQARIKSSALGPTVLTSSNLRTRLLDPC